MVHIVLVMHGTYDIVTGELTPQGVNGIGELAVVLRDIARANEKDAQVFTSSALPARGSADIISEYLDVPSQCMRELDESTDRSEVGQRMWRLADAYHNHRLPARVMILVTQAPQIADFMKFYFGEGSEQFRLMHIPDCAEAMDIEYVTSKVRVLNSRA